MYLSIHYLLLFTLFSPQPHIQQAELWTTPSKFFRFDTSTFTCPLLWCIWPFSQEAFWLVTAGEAQVYLITLKMTAASSRVLVFYSACSRSWFAFTTHWDGTEPSLMKCVSPVLFPPVRGSKPTFSCLLCLKAGIERVLEYLTQVKALLLYPLFHSCTFLT